MVKRRHCWKSATCLVCPRRGCGSSKTEPCTSLNDAATAKDSLRMPIYWLKITWPMHFVVNISSSKHNIRNCSFGKMEGLHQEGTNNTFVSPTAMYVYEGHFVFFLRCSTTWYCSSRCWAIDTYDICWHPKVYLLIHFRDHIQWKWRNNTFFENSTIPIGKSSSKLEKKKKHKQWI